MKAFRTLVAFSLIVAVFYWYIIQQAKKAVNANAGKIISKIVVIQNNVRKCFVSSSSEKLKNKHSPLIIFLHGMDGAWPNRTFTKPQYEFINKLAWENDFIAAFPEGKIGTCDIGTDISKFYYCWDLVNDSEKEFIRKFKNIIINQYNADPNKTFLIGFSNGGYFAFNYMMSKYSKEFTGYGINSGGGSFNTKSTVSGVKLPVFLSVGIKDKFQIEPIRKLKQDLISMGWEKGKNFGYDEFYGGHTINRDSFLKEVEFFLKKNKESK